MLHILKLLYRHLGEDSTLKGNNSCMMIYQYFISKALVTLTSLTAFSVNYGHSESLKSPIFYECQLEAKKSGVLYLFT